MTDDCKNLWDVVVSLLTLVGGVVAFYFGLRRWRKGQEWQRKEAAKRIVDEMLSSESANAARRMLDYPSGRAFLVIEGDHSPVRLEEYLQVLELRAKDRPGGYRKREIFIRDSFDNLFYLMGTMQHWIDARLIKFEDVKYPIDYYVRLMMEPAKGEKRERMEAIPELKGMDPWDVYKDYMKTYGMYKGLTFCCKNDFEKPSVDPCP